MKDKFPKDDKESITALCVLKAKLRAMKRCPEYLDYFDDSEAAISNQIYAFVNSKLSYRLRFSSVLWTLTNWLPQSSQKWLFDKVVGRGYDDLILARKLMVLDKIKSGIQNNVEQVVFLGGGYDPRAIIASRKYPEVKFYEVDVGKTRKLKLNALYALYRKTFNERPPKPKKDAAIFNSAKNLILLKCDLSGNNLNLGDILKKYGFNPNKTTLIFAEGLTMYLSKSDVHQLLRALETQMNLKSQIVISFRAEQKFHWLLSMLTSLSGEDLKCRLNPKEVIEFVKQNKLGVLERFSVKTWTKIIQDKDLNAQFKSGAIKNPLPYYVLSKKAKNKHISSVPEGRISVLKHLGL